MDQPELVAASDGLPVVEPAADDPEGDRIELVRTGLVRIWIGGTRYRLRRPFFGELKKLRLAQQDLHDDIEPLREEASGQAMKTLAEGKRISEDESLSPTERAKLVRDLNREDREVSRRLTEAWDDAQVAWWSQAFELVGLDGTPPDWPGWIVDGQLINRVIAHWRSAPLDHG